MRLIKNFRLCCCFAFTAWLFLGIVSAHAEPYSGTVCHDINGNVRQDSGEPGIPGVPVSNGEEAILTDASSGYDLPGNALGVGFVVKPSGGTPPIDPSTQLTDGYYLHRPDGSPPLAGR